MPYHDKPIAPKPYAFVDLADERGIVRRAPSGHDVLQPDKHAGSIDIVLTAQTPVHIASGVLEMTGNKQQPLVKELFRVGGTPVIPGSSWKGCVRSVFEAITPSCLRVTRAREIPRKIEGCRSKDNLCLACRLFGAQDFQGLVWFGDLRLTDMSKITTVQVPQFYRPRTRERTYLQGRMVRGRKFYMHGNQQAVGDTPIEVCGVGSQFQGTIDFINLAPQEIGLLFVALGQHAQHPLVLKLGGAKPACYGSVAISVTLRSSNHDTMQQRYDTWDAPQTTPTTDLMTYLQAAESVLLHNQLKLLASILQWPGREPCPSGNY